MGKRMSDSEDQHPAKKIKLDDDFTSRRMDPN